MRNFSGPRENHLGPVDNKIIYFMREKKECVPFCQKHPEKLRNSSEFWVKFNLYPQPRMKNNWGNLVSKYIVYIQKIYYTRISGPYGPLILALAEGWLASLTRGFASLNHWRGLRPLSFLKGPFLITYIHNILSNLYYIALAYWWRLSWGNINYSWKLNNAHWPYISIYKAACH